MSFQAKRRDFLKLSALHAGVVAMGFKPWEMNYKTISDPSPIVSVMQGPTDNFSTQIVVASTFQQPLQFRITPLDTTNSAELTESITVETDSIENQNLYRIYINRLSPRIPYKIDIFCESKLVDSRTFKTLEITGSHLRFAVGSCMDHSLHHPPIWQDLHDQDVDAIFLIGDQVYTDYGLKSIPPENQLWQKFYESRLILELYQFKHLKPVFAMWDDHDFGPNNGDSSYVHAEYSRQNFTKFFPQNRNYCRYLNNGPGISFSLSLCGQLFIFFDDRSFRIKNGKHERYGHWGEAQEKWALEQIHGFRGPVWLINGSQFFPVANLKESVKGEHPLQLEALTRALKDLPQKIIFVSGDIHMSEISRIEPEILGYSTVELTSSAMHSVRLPGAPILLNNPRREVYTQKWNYFLIESKTVNYDCFLRVQSRSAEVHKKTLNFKREYYINDPAENNLI